MLRTVVLLAHRSHSACVGSSDQLAGWLIRVCLAISLAKEAFSCHAGVKVPCNPSKACEATGLTC